MSTPLKVILMLVIWFIYSLVAYESCVKQCCDDGMGPATGAVEETPPDSVLTDATRFPIYFRWGDATANTNEQGFAALRDRLARGMNDNNELEITGLYYESEPKPAGYDNLGFARADAVKKLLTGAIPAERMVLRARALEDDADKREGVFEATDFNWAEVVPETAEEQVEVEELEDRIIIRFPYNSTQGELDGRVNEYLDKLAARLQQTNERITLTGHTDNTGEEDFNQRLGLARANAIQRVLVSKGIAADRITVESRGESQPVMSNDTEAGKRENRRVEVRLVQQ